MRRLSHYPIVPLVRASIRLLRRNGFRVLVMEVGRRIRNRVVLGTSVMTPPAAARLPIDYRAWRERNVSSPNDLLVRRLESNRFSYRPLISVLVPVYDVEERWLRCAIDSVLTQYYDAWELCLVDDGSPRPHIRRVLEHYARSDPRIHVLFLEENVGISAASNSALAMASGEFVALLDHDDELAPEALFEVVKILNSDPKIDLVYSDEDKLSDHSHCDPFFKPGWSPELLSSMNYITHLSVFRRSLLEEIGGFRVGFEGSQDYDLLLRVTERTTRIAHVPKILYHWRKVSGSAAASTSAKPWAYRAAQRALAESAGRQGFASEVVMLSPGRFRVRYSLPPRARVSILMPYVSDPSDLVPRLRRVCLAAGWEDLDVMVPEELELDLKAASHALGGLNVRAFQAASSRWSDRANLATLETGGEFILMMNSRVGDGEPGWAAALLEHASREQVGIVGGVVMDRRHRILESALVLEPRDVVVDESRGSTDGSGGYAGIAGVVRNCSAISGACAMIRRDLLLECGGFGPLSSERAAFLDLCLRLRERGFRVVVTPHSRVLWSGPALEIALPREDILFVRERWLPLLAQGDPYLNPNLYIVDGEVRLRMGNPV